MFLLIEFFLFFFLFQVIFNIRSRNHENSVRSGVEWPGANSDAPQWKRFLAGMNYRNYNSLDRCRNDRGHDPEFDDFGFDRRRYGSGRYVRNELDLISIKPDNPDLVQFGNNTGCVKRYGDGCHNAGKISESRRTTITSPKFSSCDCSSNCKGVYTGVEKLSKHWKAFFPPQCEKISRK